MICMAAYSATTGAAPLLLKHVIDDVFTRKDQTALALPLLIVAVFTIRCLVNFGHNYLTDYVGLRILSDIRSALNSHLQSLPVFFSAIRRAPSSPASPAAWASCRRR
jgi:ABC-type multidrug transport system fused ATPase/permease subunit